MNPRMLFAALLLVSTILIQNRAGAQATVTAQVFAEVIPALTATEISQLNFGRFSPETQGGTIIITPEGTRTSTGTVQLSGGTHNPASFSITGQSGATYTIILPSAPVLLSNLNTSKTMQVTNWTSIPAQGVGVGLLSSGAQEVKIGATLVMGPTESNPVGQYTGTYAITFGYN